MDIFLLFIFNIFTGAVIFLILSLKIEKNSSTFQEKKLKREMGEIITEFNSTAERNITLLENRISVLKKLLNENGSLKKVDFTVLDDKMKNNISKSTNSENNKKEIPVKSSEHTKRMDVIHDKDPVQDDQHNIIGTFMDKIHSFNRTEGEITSREKTKKTSGYDDNQEIEGLYGSSIIEKEVTDVSVRKKHIDLSADEEIVLKYEVQESVDIEELFHSTDDKYVLIAKLFSEGHSIEELSKYSGIPAGEIKLVISLNS